MAGIEKKVFVTTSWDDGDACDLKLADLLGSKQIPATFYVPITYRERPLNHAELRGLNSQGFEIGAHGWTHKLLWRLQPAMVTQEVAPCKKALEDILGKEVGMFCYPAGRYDANTIRALEKTGYKGARTVRMLATKLPSNPFLMPTSLQAYPHEPLTYFKNTARGRSLHSLKSYLAEMPRLRSWVELGKSLFDSVLRDGGVWHLYGHSWEIEELRLWGGLSDLLDYVSGRQEVRYVSNSELLLAKPAVSLSH
jgi:peptidoglycan-N-acetylglucosamine deacetylase